MTENQCLSRLLQLKLPRLHLEQLFLVNVFTGWSALNYLTWRLGAKSLSANDIDIERVNKRFDEATGNVSDGE